MRRRSWVALLFALLLSPLATAQSHADLPTTALAGASLADAQTLFYSARYESAAELTRSLLPSNASDLSTYELRSTALLFQIRRLIGDGHDKDSALARCDSCADLIAAFHRDNARGQALARARLKEHPDDVAALFFLGKLDLNDIWLQVGTLGRRTGWSEFWEARRSLDGVLAREPDHIRARVARAWIDYIIDTKVPRGTRWLLGGGDRKGALAMMERAANTEGDQFTAAEAQFALWNMQVRERRYSDAVVTARKLARVFPHNVELAQFIDAHSASTRE